MPQSGAAHHHQVRKRIYKNLEPFPHPNRLKRIIDTIIIIISPAGAVLTIPQVIKIWGEKTAEGLSIITWVGYLVIAVFWLIYGLVHKEKPIIIAYLLLIVVNVLVVAGIIVYS